MLSGTLPFDLIALRYTRKRLIECLVQGDHDTVVAIEKTRDEMTLTQPTSARGAPGSPEATQQAGSVVRLPTRRLRVARSASRRSRPRTGGSAVQRRQADKADTADKAEKAPAPYPFGVTSRDRCVQFISVWTPTNSRRLAKAAPPGPARSPVVRGHGGRARCRARRAAPQG